MSILKIVSGDYRNADAVQKLYNYIADISKTDMPVFGYNIIPEYTVQMFMTAKQLYCKTDAQQAIHFIISFSPKERITAETLYELSKQVSYYFYNFQVVFAVHTLQSCLHTHFMVNTVSFADGHRLICDRQFREQFLGYCAQIPFLNLTGCDCCE